MTVTVTRVREVFFGLWTLWTSESLSLKLSGHQFNQFGAFVHQFGS